MADGGVSSKNGSKDSSDRAVQQLQVVWTCYRWNDVCKVMTGRAGQLKSPSATADQFCQLYLQDANKERIFALKE